MLWITTQYIVGQFQCFLQSGRVRCNDSAQQAVALHHLADTSVCAAIFNSFPERLQEGNMGMKVIFGGK